MKNSSQMITARQGNRIMILEIIFGSCNVSSTDRTNKNHIIQELLWWSWQV